MPSKDKTVIDNRYASFSQPNIEKSDSTDAVYLAYTFAIPAQESRKKSKRLSTIAQAMSNDVIVDFPYTSNANLSAGSVL